MVFPYKSKHVENQQMDFYKYDENLLLYLWKKTKPSPGYNRAYIAILADKSKFIIEYNFVREIVKIEYYPSNDYKYYYAIIQRGTILQEREFPSHRPISLFSKINNFRNFFSYLPDEQVLKTIGGCYNIPTKSLHPQSISEFDIVQLKKRIYNFKPKNFLKSIKRYLEQKEIKQSQLKGIYKILYRLPDDVFDILVQIVLFYQFYTGKLTSLAFSFYSIFYGIFSGVVDIYWRRRNPLIIKTLFSIIPGLIIFWFYYQLKEWGIEEPSNRYLYLLKNLFIDIIKNF